MSCRVIQLLRVCVAPLVQRRSLASLYAGGVAADFSRSLTMKALLRR